MLAEVFPNSLLSKPVAFSFVHLLLSILHTLLMITPRKLNSLLGKDSIAD